MIDGQLSGRKIAFLVANEGIEQVELTRPWQAVKEAGGQPVLASTKPGKAQAFNHLDKADAFDVDVTTDQLKWTTTTGSCSRVASRIPISCGRTSTPSASWPALLRGREAGRSHLPRPLDTGRGRRGPWAATDLVAESEDRYQQRRW